MIACKHVIIPRDFTSLAHHLAPGRGGAMHFQKPGDFRHRLLVVLDELAGVRDLLGRRG